MEQSETNGSQHCSHLTFIFATSKNVARRVSRSAPGQVVHVQLYAGREFGDLVHDARRARTEGLHAARRPPWPLLHHEQGPAVSADSVYCAVQISALIAQNDSLKAQVASLDRNNQALQQKVDEKARQVAMLEAQASMSSELTKEKISAATAHAELKSLKYMLNRQGKSDLFGSGSGSAGGSRSGSPAFPAAGAGNDDRST